ncbi:MAG TPA: DNA polymerase III subunit delta' [Marmoricola sp.]|nr:DNA polymerase III subunit delta' [Marmoricola sp.]
MSVWRGLVGQEAAVATLQRAVAGDMTHAWLLTGPPGSGRSNAAMAFAAALQCADGGCGECQACHTALQGSHRDVSITRTELLSIGVSGMRDLVLRAALRPSGDRWQVMIVEDADRLTEQAGDALLKALEEPPPRTVWILCAPSVEDVLPTIRSRTRHVVLATPSAQAVTDFLVGLGVDRARAAYAARASQGHIGRAKALATDPATLSRRKMVTELPLELTTPGRCLGAAENLVNAATEEAKAMTETIDAEEKDQLDTMFGVVERGRRPKEYAPALKQLTDAQRLRGKRRILDVIDRGLMDLVSVYRDAMSRQLGTGAELINEEMRPQIDALARRTTAAGNLRRIETIFAAREQMLEFNVPPLLACESMMIGLHLDESGAISA